MSVPNAVDIFHYCLPPFLITLLPQLMDKSTVILYHTLSYCYCCPVLVVAPGTFVVSLIALILGVMLRWPVPSLTTASRRIHLGSEFSACHTKRDNHSVLGTQCTTPADILTLCNL